MTYWPECYSFIKHIHVADNRKYLPATVADPAYTDGLLVNKNIYLSWLNMDGSVMEKENTEFHNFPVTSYIILYMAHNQKLLATPAVEGKLRVCHKTTNIQTKLYVSLASSCWDSLLSIKELAVWADGRTDWILRSLGSSPNKRDVKNSGGQI